MRNYIIEGVGHNNQTVSLNGLYQQYQQLKNKAVETLSTYIREYIDEYGDGEEITVYQLKGICCGEYDDYDDYYIVDMESQSEYFFSPEGKGSVSIQWFRVDDNGEVVMGLGNYKEVGLDFMCLEDILCVIMTFFDSNINK